MNEKQIQDEEEQKILTLLDEIVKQESAHFEKDILRSLESEFHGLPRFMQESSRRALRAVFDCGVRNGALAMLEKTRPLL